MNWEIFSKHTCKRASGKSGRTIIEVGSSRYACLLLTVNLLLTTGCSQLHINPPTPDNQSLLVLPIKLDNQAQYGRHGFVYHYEIVSEDGKVPPYEAVFKLPIKGDMLTSTTELATVVYSRDEIQLPK